jgi:hypothetical protein
MVMKAPHPLSYIHGVAKWLQNRARKPPLERGG